MKRFKKEKKSLAERGVPMDSSFEAHLEDGNVLREQEHNWSDLSEERDVEHPSGTKRFPVSRFPIKRLIVQHGDLETEVEIPKGCEVYQVVCSRLFFLPDGSRHISHIGRVVGIVKDGKVVEERFLNGATDEIRGFRI